jgi:hypothetical protein
MVVLCHELVTRADDDRMLGDSSGSVGVGACSGVKSPPTWFMIRKAAGAAGGGIFVVANPHPCGRRGDAFAAAAAR